MPLFSCLFLAIISTSLIPGSLRQLLHDTALVMASRLSQGLLPVVVPASCRMYTHQPCPSTPPPSTISITSASPTNVVIRYITYVLVLAFICSTFYQLKSIFLFRTRIFLPIVPNYHRYYRLQQPCFSKNQVRS